MLHTVPKELLDEIYSQTDAYTLIKISTLSRFLHLSALQHLFDRNKVFHSSNTKATLNTAENLHVIEALCTALPAVLPPLQSILCVFNAPLETLFQECKGLRRLVIKRRTLEVVLDFQQSMFTGREWEVHPNKWNIRPLEDLLVTMLLGHSQSLTLLRGHIPWSPPLPPRVRRRGLFSGSLGAIIGTILDLVEKPPLPPRNTSLHTLNIHSSFPFHRAFSTWREIALMHPSIRTLAFKDPRQSSQRWHEFLPLMALPNLTHLFLNDCGMAWEDLTAFLIRHRRITTLDFGLAIYPTVTSKVPWFFLHNVTTLSASPSVIAYLLRKRSRGIGILSDLKSITINHFFYPGHRFFFSGININLSAVDKQLRGLELSFRAQVVHDAVAWLQLNPIEDPSDAKPLLRVKRVELCPDDLGFLAIPDVQALLPDWLCRFPQVRVLSLVGCVGVLGDGRDVRAELARGIVDRGTSIEVLRFDDEERGIEDWLVS